MIVKSIMCNDSIFAQFSYETDREGKVKIAIIDCLFRHSHKFNCVKYTDFIKAENAWQYLIKLVN